MVAECFNDFFINVAKDIGSETAADKNHPSIIEINKNKKDIPNLESTCVCFSWFGNTEFVIVLFIIFVIGFAITGLASFNNFKPFITNKGSHFTKNTIL
jgi:hypothetical protein